MSKDSTSDDELESKSSDISSPHTPNRSVSSSPVADAKLTDAQLKDNKKWWQSLIEFFERHSFSLAITQLSLFFGIFVSFSKTAWREYMTQVPIWQGLPLLDYIFPLAILIDMINAVVAIYDYNRAYNKNIGKLGNVIAKIVNALTVMTAYTLKVLTAKIGLQVGLAVPGLFVALMLFNGLHAISAFAYNLYGYLNAPADSKERAEYLDHMIKYFIKAALSVTLAIAFSVLMINPFISIPAIIGVSLGMLGFVIVRAIMQKNGWSLTDIFKPFTNSSTSPASASAEEHKSSVVVTESKESEEKATPLQQKNQAIHQLIAFAGKNLRDQDHKNKPDPKILQLATTNVHPSEPQGRVNKGYWAHRDFKALLATAKATENGQAIVNKLFVYIVSDKASEMTNLNSQTSSGLFQSKQKTIRSQKIKALGILMNQISHNRDLSNVKADVMKQCPDAFLAFTKKKGDVEAIFDAAIEYCGRSRLRIDSTSTTEAETDLSRSSSFSTSSPL